MSERGYEPDHDGHKQKGEQPGFNLVQRWRKEPIDQAHSDCKCAHDCEENPVSLHEDADKQANARKCDGVLDWRDGGETGIHSCLTKYGLLRRRQIPRRTR